MRWIIAAGIGGAILEGIFWYAFFASAAGVDPMDLLLGGLVVIAIGSVIVGIGTAIFLGRAILRR